jgi:proline iminopeptidase
MQNFLLLITCVIFLIFSCNDSSNNQIEDEVRLWPEIKPFKADYLKVSDIHKIYYKLCGNPNGKPVFVLHGGPGGSSSPSKCRFFNPNKFLIISYDQRGAGKSLPYGELSENTTQHLIQDIDSLRRFLDLKEIMIFGGSWGSTLALAYAETYPENVSAMVLCGIYLCTKEENHHYYVEARKFFPDVYDKLLSTLPPMEEPLNPDFLLQLIQNSDSLLVRKYCTAWAKYEYSIGKLVRTDEETEKLFKDYNPYAIALYENYYISNDCFLEEGQLLNNAEKLTDIPVILVSGRYDMICPPITAYRLHKKLPNSKLIITEGAGHSSKEKTTEYALLQAIKEFE